MSRKLGWPDSEPQVKERGPQMPATGPTSSPTVHSRPVRQGRGLTGRGAFPSCPAPHRPRPPVRRREARLAPRTRRFLLDPSPPTSGSITDRATKGPPRLLLVASPRVELPPFLIRAFRLFCLGDVGTLSSPRRLDADGALQLMTRHPLSTPRLVGSPMPGSALRRYVRKHHE